MTENLAKVENIIVLMLENRSFDNLIGYLYSENGNKSPNGDVYDGLTGAESNPMPQSGQQAGQPVFVMREKKSTTIPDPDPGEEYQHINMQLFSINPPPATAKATNQGFVLDYDQVLQEDPKSHADVTQIMRCYDPSAIPCMAEIIRRYAVCDRWFASVPSQTWPNRSFVHAGSSNGHVNNAPNNPLLWRIPTVFNRMASMTGVSWRVYYDELFISLTRLQMSQLWPQGYSKNFQPFKQFLHDANSGALPSYAFIEPNFFPNPITGELANDQHPNHDVSIGDSFIGKVFNAIVTSPQWLANEVLFMITYDEHGGCYDHVFPPTNATPPDSIAGAYGFDFRRFGVRVPAVVVSPFVPPGSVFRAPQGKTPFDHTSILATVERRFAIKPLSKRDVVSPDVSIAMSLSQPRQDSSPLTIVIPEMEMLLDARGRNEIASTPLNDLQQSMVTAMHFAAFGTPREEPQGAEAELEPTRQPETVRTVGDAFAYIRSARQKTAM
jgi:phospholipase C